MCRCCNRSKCRQLAGARSCSDHHLANAPGAFSERSTQRCTAEHGKASCRIRDVSVYCPSMYEASKYLNKTLIDYFIWGLLCW